MPLTASLSARWSSTVTDVLAYDADRRWLLMADAGEPLRDLGNPPERWLEVLPAYARLQIGETEHAADHLDAGACIERGRRWQAEHYVGAVRDHALSLACLRAGLPTAQARGYDDLPAEILARLADATSARSIPRRSGQLWLPPLAS